MFVCVGDGEAGYRDEIRMLGDKLGLSKRLIWAGIRHDMRAVYNALDIVTSSSIYGEGFPNVIGEAMACGVPCVVTDVGDNARIVDDTGIVVPPNKPDALCDGWKRMLKSTSSISAGRTAVIREHIVDRFSIKRLIENTSEALINLL
jgi:glycosyltransferase involved in cell wall biosynthesis